MRTPKERRQQAFLFYFISVELLPNISVNATWSEHGVTVAGGHGQGDGLHQLSIPIGLYVDEDQTVYIADSLNHRIIAWKRGATIGQVVAGGNGQGNGTDQLNEPTDVILDKRTDTLIICDWGNQRVMRFSRQNGTKGETIVPIVACSRLTMDNEGFLYVSDYHFNEVRRYRMGEIHGIVVAGGHGAGDSFNQLNWPTHVVVDADQSVYVSELNNHRVSKWIKNEQKGIIVAGGRGPGDDLTRLCLPRGIVVDQLGQVYVADCQNNRVIRWRSGDIYGVVIVGGKDTNPLNFPVSLSFDRDGNLYVVDQNNHRVQRFDIKDISF
ncbi:unnamed protein product [Rotaria sp. Silwood2]|nr:unnamed protein product [Rotaria sp. Silwood2]CAF2988675.1 unnamed protein product [Rotaria sp. Silwood2]CAF3205965.1 unnamed protein product [Rotaria sp. Silwood2]CAF3362306.1 unnamed protein product [Rotaria sp. Silwood2]CAF4231958.1 unnamed protein product [Rotaria sp. Silwood2]